MEVLFTMTSMDVVVAHVTQANEQTTAVVAKHKDLYGSDMELDRQFSQETTNDNK